MKNPYEPQWADGFETASTDDPPYFQFDHLKAITGVIHGVFTRQGGVSKGAFESLNTSLGVGDREAAVKANRDRIRQSLDATDLIFASQVHGCHVARIDGPGNRLPGGAPLRADALVTCQTGRFLAIQVADCQAVLVADPVARVVANIHAGWRGTVQNIVGRTIRIMVREYGCRRGDLRVGIGPSLGPCCAEFVNYREEIPARWWPYQNGRHYFDFWAITHAQLLAEGISGANIANSRLCTRCNSDLFFSYRREKTTGRFTVAIGLQ